MRVVVLAGAGLKRCGLRLAIIALLTVAIVLSGIWPSMQGSPYRLEVRASDTEESPGQAGSTETTSTLPVQGFDEKIMRVNVRSDGSQSEGGAYNPFMSADGRYVVFESDASDLVAGDKNDCSDIFVYNRETGAIERISVSNSGTEGDHHSKNPSISADGRYVAFESDARNLVENDTNDKADVFVLDRLAGKIELVSISAVGGSANGHSTEPLISADGGFVAFSSTAGNLVGNDTNGLKDIFVRDLQAGKTELVSISDNGTQNNNSNIYNPSINSGGRYVVFEALASNLVDGDNNGECDIFVYDRQEKKVKRLSASTTGNQANRGSREPKISADGNYVAFESLASNLVAGDTNNRSDIFVYNMLTGETELVSASSTGELADDHSKRPFISSDGRYVSFASYAGNLVAGGGADLSSDIYVRDMMAGTTERVSQSEAGAGGNENSDCSSISADGRLVVFNSEASNLVDYDTNGSADVFIYDRVAGGRQDVIFAVFTTDPKSGATGVAKDKTITITFSKAIVQSDAFNGITLKGPNSGTVTAVKVINDSKLTVNPEVGLSYETAYTVLIPAGAVEDTAGNLLSEDYSFSFTVQTKPVVSPPTLGGGPALSILGGPGSDIQPPTAPKGLRLVSYSDAVSLVWDKNDETDLAGYNIYRRESAGGNFSKLNSAQLAREEYEDKTAEAEKIYVYCVTAVDSAGNESLKSSLVKAILVQAKSAVIFKDIPGNAWYKDYLIRLSLLEILGGYRDRTLRPLANVTRAEFAKIIVPAMGWGIAGLDKPSFSDVGIDHWAYWYVEAAEARGVIDGYHDGSFKPGSPATRAEIAKSIALALNLPEGDAGLNGGPKDIDRHWAREYIYACIKVGIISGYPDGTFRPDNPVTRAEVARMVSGVLDYRNK